MTDDRTQIVTKGSTVEIGTELNQTYRIDALIGVGGMGEVFKGHNIQTGDPVAIKVVLPEYARDEMIFELFRKEARVLNHLSHDAIVRYYVFSLDRALGRPYLAMEFVDGPSLAERIKTTPLTPTDFFGLLHRLADGLHKAHEAGVIHRDISPDNVILPDASVENAKIIDFGIARTASVGGATLLGGSFAGKYNYVSPEQLGLYGGEVTPKSDIYSLGLTMAAAIRGRALDMSGTQVEVIDKRRAVPNLSGIGIPKQVHAILTAMLQPDPANRPATMAEVRDWIDKDQSGTKSKTRDTKSNATKAKQALVDRTPALGSSSAPKASSNAMRNTALAAGIVTVIGVGAFGGWIYVQSQQSVDRTIAPIQTAENTIVTPPTNNDKIQADTGAAVTQSAESTTVIPPKSNDRIPADTSAAAPPVKEIATIIQPKINDKPPPETSAAPTHVAEKVLSVSPKVIDIAPANKSATSVSVPNSDLKSRADTNTTAAPATFDVAALSHYVSGYGIGKCFKVDVTSMSETTAKLTALGTEEARSVFEREFITKSGYSPQIAFNPVTQDQCAFVSSLSKLPSNTKMPLQLQLDRNEIRGNQRGQSAIGDALNVKVTGIGDRMAYLYVVDYSGGIQNINRSCPNCIKATSGEMTATLSLTPPESASGDQVQTYPMIVLAVAAAKPLYAINNQDAYESTDFTGPLVNAALSAENFSAQTAYVTLKDK